MYSYLQLFQQFPAKPSHFSNFWPFQAIGSHFHQSAISSNAEQLQPSLLFPAIPASYSHIQPFPAILAIFGHLQILFPKISGNFQPFPSVYNPVQLFLAIESHFSQLEPIIAHITVLSDNFQQCPVILNHVQSVLHQLVTL